MLSTDRPRTRRLPALFLSLILVGAVAACAGERPPGPGPAAVPPVPPVALEKVLAAVRKAPQIRTVPPDLTPSLATVGEDFGFDHDKCEAGPTADRIDACVLGDPASSAKVVLFGDSHAGMWLPPLTEIAQRRHWQLRFFGKPACPTPHLRFWYQQQGRPFAECDRFRAYAEAQILAERPDLVLVTNESFSQKSGPGVLVTPEQWQAGLTDALRTLQRSGARIVVIGDTPVLDESAPDCLAAHPTDVPACATDRTAATARVWNLADQTAAKATGSGYVPVLPWLCTAVCTPMIGNVVVYRNRFHLTATYSRLLNGVLETALSRYLPADVTP